MHLRPPQIEFEDENPFESDLLGRQQTAESLTELARSANDGLIISLHGPWGSGKSTFLRMWQSQLAKVGFRSITFNAWETDFSDDPLVALIGELEAGLSSAQQGEDSDTSALRRSLVKAKTLGGKLLKGAIPTAVRIATAGALDLDAFSEKAIADLTAKLAEDKIAAYESAKKSLKAFRESIAEVAAAATVDSTSGKKLPLVFIVDELDRCRPPYAIRVLECIKHLFNVPGVMFVFAIDAEQLSHTVRSQYGEAMDAQGYLRRGLSYLVWKPLDLSRLCPA